MNTLLSFSLSLLRSKARLSTKASGKGRFGGVLITLLFPALCLMAVETDYMKDPKYLLGAVPEVDGIVTFQKNFTVTEKSEQQIYDILRVYTRNSLLAGGIPNQQPEYTRIVSEDRSSGIIVARVEEYMTFSHVLLNLDRTRFRYMLTASVKGQKVSLLSPSRHPATYRIIMQLLVSGEKHRTKGRRKSRCERTQTGVLSACA